MTRRYAFVGCGKAKNDGELPAREKYASTYFQKKAEWAETYCDEWWILSAKYGAIEPDEVIDDYDVTISDLEHKGRAAFFRSAYRALQTPPIGLIEGQLFVLAGKDYIEALGSLLDPASWEDYEVILPFEGTEGIGEQLAWLTDQLESGEFDTWVPETNDRPRTEQTTLIPDGGRTRIEHTGPRLYESSIEGCIYADCPTCTNTMRLGELWVDLILNDGKDVPECPECDDGRGDSWSDDADPIVDGHELWACMGEELDPDADHSDREVGA